MLDLPSTSQKQLITVVLSIAKALFNPSSMTYVTYIYLGFIIVMMFSFAMDAQEVVFTQEVIGLSEMEYSLSISITGIGSIAGATLLSILSSKFSIRHMIVISLTMTTLGYVVYTFSWSFSSIAMGFVILGFYNVFMNAGIMTIY